MKPHLLRWLMRPALPASLLLAGVTLFWVLLEDSPLWRFSLLPPVIIFLHAILTTSVLYWAWGRAGSFGFIQTRGHSTSTLWKHRLLASACLALIVWMPAALATLTPLRSWLQGDLFQNPYYPIMATRDASEVIRWSLLYTVFLPATHYAWIRQSQPCRFPGAGHWLLAALPILLYTWHRCLKDSLTSSLVLTLTLLTLTLSISALFLLGGRHLSRTMELSQS